MGCGFLRKGSANKIISRIYRRINGKKVSNFLKIVAPNEEKSLYRYYKAMKNVKIPCF